MSTTVRDATDRHVTAPVGGVVLDRAWVRRSAVLLLLAAAFNVWVWATRAVNLLNDERAFSTAFVAVHLVLFGTSLVLAVVTARIGWQLRRAAGRGTDGTSA